MVPVPVLSPLRLPFAMICLNKILFCVGVSMMFQSIPKKMNIKGTGIKVCDLYRKFLEAVRYKLLKSIALSKNGKIVPRGNIATTKL